MKKHIFYLSAVAVASSLLISNLNAFEVNEKKVDAKRVLELKNEGYVLLDTRPEAEFKKCTIAGAQNNPIKDADAFMEWAKKNLPGKNIVVFGEPNEAVEAFGRLRLMELLGDAAAGRGEFSPREATGPEKPGEKIWGETFLYDQTIAEWKADGNPTDGPCD